MIRCLCCGKEIPDSATEAERRLLWHARCSQRFFGSKIVPEIDITEEHLYSLAVESTTKGFTVPGVQKKLSLHLAAGNRAEKPRLTLVNYPTGYILKPQTEEYAALPEAEYLVMSMAKLIGIRTVPFALILQDGKLAYITKRIDRDIQGKNKSVTLFAMEDFCQLDGRLTQDKYRGSYERCAKIISRYSARAGLDMTELYLRVLFSYAVGNSDMHLKNFSLIAKDENSREYSLSDAYDMLPVNIVLPEDPDQMALSLNGKKRNITGNDFLKFADSCQIDRKVAIRLVKHLIGKKEEMISLCRNSYLPDEMKERLVELIRQRMDRLASVGCKIE